MTPRSDYLAIELGNVLILEDLDQGSKSLTNDMERVLKDLEVYGYDLDELKVVYRDSEGDWARVLRDKAGAIHFKHVMPEFSDAIQKARS